MSRCALGVCIAPLPRRPPASAFTATIACNQEENFNRFQNQLDKSATEAVPRLQEVVESSRSAVGPANRRDSPGGCTSSDPAPVVAAASPGGGWWMKTVKGKPVLVTEFMVDGQPVEDYPIRHGMCAKLGTHPENKNMVCQKILAEGDICQQHRYQG